MKADISTLHKPDILILRRQVNGVCDLEVEDCVRAWFLSQY